jgi:hypothetical protein
MPSPEKTESNYRWFSLGLLLLCVGIGIATIRDYGMGWDEVTRWKSGDLKVEYYNALFSSDDPMVVLRSAETDAYPGFFDINLSLLHRLAGGDRFILGHGQAFVFGLVGLIALWGIGSVFGGARLGFWAVVLMVLTPTFYGHWFHNPKDVPFAATYTLGLWGMIEFFRRYPVFKKRLLVATGIAVGLCMATRVAGMVLLAYFTAAVVVVVIIRLWENRKNLYWQRFMRGLWPWLIALPCVSLIAYATLFPWWPASHRDLLSISGATLQELHTRASDIPLFFRGAIIWAADAPFYYTLWMFLIKVTELMLIGLILLVPFSWLRLRAYFTTDRSMRLAPALVVLLLGGFFPLFYLTWTAPALHNGARHFLFVFPALCVCAAWAYLQANDWIQANRPTLWRAALLVFALLVLFPLTQLIKLHPYQYVYFNSLAGGVAGAYGSYESEYWFTCSKHAVEELQLQLDADPVLMPTDGTVQIFVLGPRQVVEPFIPGHFEIVGDPNLADFLILNTQMLMHTRYAGEELFRIERMGAPLCVVLRNQPEPYE